VSDATHSDTIDWDSFWRAAGESEAADASPSGEHVVDALPEFFAERGRPDSFVDVGCGPGVVSFAMAERYPDATVVGYDAAESVLADNRERATEMGLDNLAFERTVLPAFPDREFDAVFSYFTLCYVADVESALQNMYDAVAPGGHLIFNYHNRYARAYWQTMADDPDEYLDPIRARWKAEMAPSDWKKARVRESLADGADLETAITEMQRDYIAKSRETESFVEWL